MHPPNKTFNFLIQHNPYTIIWWEKSRRNVYAFELTTTRNKKSQICSFFRIPKNNFIGGQIVKLNSLISQKRLKVSCFHLSLDHISLIFRRTSRLDFFSQILWPQLYLQGETHQADQVCFTIRFFCVLSAYHIHNR
jgi:hypothetical protein